MAVLLMLGSETDNDPSAEWDDQQKSGIDHSGLAEDWRFLERLFDFTQ